MHIILARTLALLCALWLAGCTTATNTVSSLQNDALLRAERRFSMTHAQVQKALFEHERRCGRGPVFALSPRSTNEATVVYALEDPPQRQRTVLIVLQQATGWNGLLMTARAYAGFQVSQEQVERVFSAIHDPQTCFD